MSSKPNKYSSDGKLYSLDNPRPKSEDGIVVEGYFHTKGSFMRTTEERIRPYVNRQRRFRALNAQAKKARHAQMKAAKGA